MRILFSACGPLSEREVYSLKTLCGLLANAGVSARIWMDKGDARLGEFVIQETWDKQVALDQMRSLSLLHKFIPAMFQRRQLSRESTEKWWSRLQRDPDDWVLHRCPGTKRENLLATLLRISERVLSNERPTHFFAWNPLYYYFGVPAEFFAASGVKSGSLERGVLLNTLLFDRGLFSQSDLAEWGICDFGTPPGGVAFDHLSRVGSLWAGANEQSLPTISSEPIVLVLPTSDFQSGAIPHAARDARALLPCHADFPDLIDHLISLKLGRVVVKPHPHCSRSWMTSDACASAVVEGDALAWIAKSSVVIANGTKLEFAAVAAGKPLVLPGFGLLWNKGVAYEATTRNDLLPSLRSALDSGLQPIQKCRFSAYVDWLMRERLLDTTRMDDPEYAALYTTRFLNWISDWK